MNFDNNNIVLWEDCIIENLNLTNSKYTFIEFKNNNTIEITNFVVQNIIFP